MAVMSTTLVSSLLLYKHRTVQYVPHPGVCVSELKCAPTSLRIHQYFKSLINRIGFRASLLECDGDFLSHTHQSLTNVTRWLMLTSDFVTELLHPSPSQGVRASVLCRDVAWLTEELLFRNKDVGFGGTLVEVVHYSLSQLAPHLIIAAAPSRLAFCRSKQKTNHTDELYTAELCCLSKMIIPWSETSVSI